LQCAAIQLDGHELAYGCGRRSSGLYVCSTVYRYYFGTDAQCLLLALKGKERFANQLKHSDWLRLRPMDQSQEILLGHSVFASENMVAMVTIILQFD